MKTEFLMGNHAIAKAAVRCGATVVTGYPGTPSTEVIEAIARFNDGRVNVQWSVNEKAALEVAAGASYAGARTLVTMKQVGLNVASDPLMSLAYVGTNGGMVIMVADDPGPISSQTEQDTRTFACYSKLPLFDPSSPEEAYEMMADAYALSEKYNTPVILRPTTRICHACAAIETDDTVMPVDNPRFEKDPKWVIFPRLSYNSHIKIEERNERLRSELSESKYNTTTFSGRKGVAAGGDSVAYAKEALSMLNTDCSFFKVGTPFPFPEKLAVEFLKGVDEVLVYEELDPVIEKELVYLCGKYNLNVKIQGKLTHHTKCAGENSVEDALDRIGSFLGVKIPEDADRPTPPQLPVRPPVLCAGCPHRASFYAVKQAMKGKKTLFAGDIGCYTLGNAMPLDMTDTCLCMGAGITIAQGMNMVEPDRVCFSFTGDSTFFHTGIAGIVNAIYNNSHMVAVILDNANTAMTGSQPNPSTGKNAMGEIAEKISIEKVLESLGVKNIQIINPFDQDKAIEAAKTAAQSEGVSAIIYCAPCIAVAKPKPAFLIDEEKCIGCKKCIRELGCPAIFKKDGKAAIDSALCYGCGICQRLCPVKAIGGSENV